MEGEEVGELMKLYSALGDWVSERAHDVIAVQISIEPTTIEPINKELESSNLYTLKKHNPLLAIENVEVLLLLPLLPLRGRGQVVVRGATVSFL